MMEMIPYHWSQIGEMFKPGEAPTVTGIGDGNATAKKSQGANDGGKVGDLKNLRRDRLTLVSKEGTSREGLKP